MFGKAFESDSHAKPDYNTTGRVLVEMSYHTRSSSDGSEEGINRMYRISKINKKQPVSSYLLYPVYIFF